MLRHFVRSRIQVVSFSIHIVVKHVYTTIGIVCIIEDRVINAMR